MTPGGIEVDHLLTGRRRHVQRRVGFFRRRYVLVLQVEAWTIEWCGHIIHVKRWRDATLSEAMEIKAL
jgi:hypothetical protein